MTLTRALALALTLALALALAVAVAVALTLTLGAAARAATGDEWRGGKWRGDHPGCRPGARLQGGRRRLGQVRSN